MRILIINPPDEFTIQGYPDENGVGFIEADDYGSFPPPGAPYILSSQAILRFAKHLSNHFFARIQLKGFRSREIAEGVAR